MQDGIIQRRKRMLFLSGILVLTSLILLGQVSIAAAQDLPQGVVIGDENGIYATSEGEYYVDLPNILPGETYKKEITIRSLDVKEPFELGLLVSEKSSTGLLDLNKAVTLTLTLDGKQLYKGNLLGNGSFDWTSQPLVIGKCEYGKDQIMTAEFVVDKGLSEESFKKESQLLYHWTFVATKNQPDTSDTSVEEVTENTTKHRGILPMTGEEIRNLIYKVLTGMLIVLIILLLWKKKREKEEGGNSK